MSSGSLFWNHVKAGIPWMLAVLFLYAVGVLLVKPAAVLISEVYPENFAWQFHRAINAGELDKAADIARARVEAEHYDFAARRFLAQAQIASGNAADATDVLLTSLDRTHAISGRDVYSLGLNPGEDYDLLSTALNMQGRSAFASEMARAAEDARHPYLPGNSIDLGSSITAGQQLVPDIIRDISLEAFKLSSGVTNVTSEGLVFTRNSSATVSLDDLPTSVSKIVFWVQGSKIMGFGALLKATINGNELIRIYADSVSPRQVAVHLPSHINEENITLTLEFLNDAFDPISKLDRNINILRIGLF